jgi:predicted small metal-binding protein
MQTSTRKVNDCREFPSDSNCTLTIAGTEDEVIKAATEHAISSHGHSGGPELVDALRSMLRSEN